MQPMVSLNPGTLSRLHDIRRERMRYIVNLFYIDKLLDCCGVYTSYIQVVNLNKFEHDFV